ncbi:MAG: magnesium-protoporphyrin IX monomethyl ester (oxidative) cyclase [Cyanobacteriota bacterium]
MPIQASPFSLPMSVSISTPFLYENLLTPRFYTTDIAKAALADLSEQRQCFEAMLQEMERDYNRDHFDRRANLDRLAELTPKERQAYGSYLVRSCVSEFSGFLLFKELSQRLVLKGRNELSRLFNLMARDEARHAGFLNRALLSEGIAIDLPSLSAKRAITWNPLSWVLYSVYLSEKIGYWRYILIDRHLKANPAHTFTSLVGFFEPWCQDENRHGDILNMLIRCWPGLRSGWRGCLLSRFFLWSVFLTHSLTVGERREFYSLLGLEPSRFDEEVIRQTNRTAKRAFPAVFALEGGEFFGLRDQIVATLGALQTRQPQKPVPIRLLHDLALRSRLVGLLIRQFCQPMVTTQPHIA